MTGKVLALAAVGSLLGSNQAMAEAELGRYEVEALDEALVREATTVETAPEGKVVAAIRVVNLDVFLPGDGFLLRLNRLHVTTKSSAIEREILVRPGEVWDEARIRESERNLEVPEYSSLVVIVPVVSRTLGAVDILVVTRDVWSLRTSSKIEVQNSTLTRLLMFPAENNFLGLRKQVSLRFLLDLGAVSIGPRYVDPNIGGTHLTFGGFAQAIFSRAESDYEGQRIDLELEMPFWSLRNEWGGRVRFAEESAVERTFRDTEILLHPDPDRAGADPNEARAAREFRLRTIAFSAEATRGLSASIAGQPSIHRFSLGYELRERRPSLLESFPNDPALAELFADEVLGSNERLAGPFVRYRGFLAAFTTFKNVETLDIVEDVRVGPEATLTLSPAFEAFGSELNLFRAAGEVAWTVDFGGAGFARASLGGNLRVAGEGVTGAELAVSAFAALPSMGRLGRIILSARYDDLIENIDDKVLLAGAQVGLRGYKIGAFAGESRVLVNAELRSAPLAFKALRVNGVVFYDAGDAASQPSELAPHHNVGIGFRFVLPQDTRFVNRIDWAFPIDRGQDVLPGRFSFSFGQFF